MKAIYIILLILISINTYAQVPQGIPYQAVARNGQGQPLASTNVKVRFSILDSTATGTAVYVESHSTTTSALGLFSANVGMGTASTGSFSSINWGQNYKFLKVELDTTATGNSYIDLGTQQMMSVPYALYSGISNYANTVNFGGISLSKAETFGGSTCCNNTILLKNINVNAGMWVRIEGSMSRGGNCGGGEANIILDVVSGSIDNYQNSGLSIGYNTYVATQTSSGIIYFRAVSNSVINVRFNTYGGGCNGSVSGMISY